MTQKRLTPAGSRLYGTNMMICHACGKKVDAADRVGRREQCAFCGADLHCCRNCAFYEPGAYNDCRETQAERVVDKIRSNFCDYFRFGDSAATEGRRSVDTRNRLEDLFKK
ncbi:MAG TPA: hypothetical protein PK090_08580 [Smithellaceae bacterium]|nr:hypothetical protein [Smithellaceae bacterium]